MREGPGALSSGETQMRGKEGVTWSRPRVIRSVSSSTVLLSSSNSASSRETFSWGGGTTGPFCPSRWTRGSRTQSPASTGFLSRPPRKPLGPRPCPGPPWSSCPLLTRVASRGRQKAGARAKAGAASRAPKQQVHSPAGQHHAEARSPASGTAGPGATQLCRPLAEGPWRGLSLSFPHLYNGASKTPQPTGLLSGLNES